MKTKILAMMLLAGGSMFAQTRFSIGISFGGHGAGFYQPPPSYAYNIPACPGPDYAWTDGYWSQDYGRNIWVAGHWTRRSFNRSYQVEPRVESRFNDRNHGQAFSRAFENDRSRGYAQNQNRSFGRQERGDSYENGFRSR